MIQFFRKSYAVQYVIFCVLALALWAPALIIGYADVALRSPVAPLFNLVADVLSFSSYAMVAFAFLLLIAEALIFNTIMVKNQITLKNSIIAAVVFLVLMSLTWTQATFSPFLMACFFLLLMFDRLYKIYQSSSPELYLFDAGLFLALATMCYFPCIVLVPWLIVTLGMLRVGTFRTQLIPPLGFFSVYLLLFSVYYLMGVLPEQIQQYVGFFTTMPFGYSGFNAANIAVIVAVGVVAFVPYLQSDKFNFEKSIAVRIKLSLMQVLLLFAVLLLFVGGSPLSHGLVFVVFAVLLSYDLSYMDRLFWANLIAALLLLFILSNHYFFKFV